MFGPFIIPEIYMTAISINNRAMRESLYKVGFYSRQETVQNFLAHTHTPLILRSKFCEVKNGHIFGRGI